VNLRNKSIRLSKRVVVVLNTLSPDTKKTRDIEKEEEST